jgi:hypothetical protein
LAPSSTVVAFVPAPCSAFSAPGIMRPHAAPNRQTVMHRAHFRLLYRSP